MFVGREDELKELNNRYNSDKFECIIIWGRRRVGKTELISKFCENKKAIFFTGIEANDEINFQNFSNSVSKTLLNTEVLFENWEKAFSFIGEKAKKERILLVMDEYPYVAESNRTVSS
ncbi:MAG: AAA family ATPase, partial [Clostridiales bacterium]|nr:AAA family ATPase [Clostridiales bacterium]